MDQPKLELLIERGIQVAFHLTWLEPTSPILDRPISGIPLTARNTVEQQQRILDRPGKQVESLFQIDAQAQLATKSISLSVIPGLLARINQIVSRSHVLKPAFLPVHKCSYSYY